MDVFYPGRPDDPGQETSEYLAACAPAEKDSRKPWAVMLPHAGYIFCGNIIGKNPGRNRTCPKAGLVVLCPNHTGRGQVLGVWPSREHGRPVRHGGCGREPGSTAHPERRGFTADTNSHFLRAFDRGCILPLSAGSGRREAAGHCSL